MHKYYKTGMISLLFLPLLWIPFVKDKFKERDLRMMKLNMPSECKSSEWEWCNEDIYDTNELTLIDKLDFREIEDAFEILQKLGRDSLWLSSKPYDYSKTYVIKLDDSVSWGELVQLLSLCEEYGIKRFQIDIYKDKFAFQEMYNLRPMEEVDENLPFWSCILLEEVGESKVEEVFYFIDSSYGLISSENRYYYYWVLAACLMFVIAIVSRHQFITKSSDV